MKLLENIQNKLEASNVFKYIDEDWGQLADSKPPVQWPCILFDITSATYSDIGTDRRQTPNNRQQGTAMITFTIADLKLTNSSARAPKVQKQNAWNVHELIEKAHAILQGFNPECNCGGLLRSGMRKVKRDDGVQMYQVTYTVGLHNV